MLAALRRGLLPLLPTALVLAALLALPGPGARGEEPPQAAPVTPADVPESERVPPPAPPDVDAALRRGVDYLVGAQNKDGSWGTPASNLWDIYAPFPGSQQAFQVASSALALMGLMASQDATPRRRGRDREGAAPG